MYECASILDNSFAIRQLVPAVFSKVHPYHLHYT